MFCSSRRCIAAALLCAAFPIASAHAQPAPALAGPAAPAYADTARRVLAAPLVIDATVRSAVRITGAEAAGLPAGNARFYVTADVGALIRGTGALPTRIAYVADVPLDAGGRAPRLRRSRVLLFARSVNDAAGQVQLVSGDAQLPWTPALDAQVRGIVREVIAADAPPAILGPGNAFFVPGALPGEGETQIFLQTETGAPVSIQVLRRPGQAPSWSVALGDIIDAAAGPPQRDTLLWYRLACSLPPELPEASLRSAEPGTTETARADYRFVIAALGPCR